MNIFYYVNLFVSSFNYYFKVPSVIIFFLVAIILTVKNRFLQFTGFKRFLNLISQKYENKKKKINIINPFHALFTAMATTIGVGNIVGPSIAISLAGPGALFWLIVYIFFSSAIKFTEVSFAVYSREVTDDNVIGGPFQYLKLISKNMAKIYAGLAIILFTVWSSIQVNTISSIFYCENICPKITASVSVLILLFIVLGGIKRIGSVLSKLVPFMLIFYLIFSLYIIFKDFSKLFNAIKLVLSCAFSFKAVCGGTLGASMFIAIREGVYKSIFITESGIGTSSIAHSMSDVKKPTDQGILAMFSGIADIILCLLSGLIALVTGLWQSSNLNNTIVYQAFKLYCPFNFIQIFLLLSMFLFSLTSLIGNTFNGGQSFASLFGYKYIKFYFILSAAIAFSGALIEAKLLWDLMDIVLAFVVAINLSGILILSFKYNPDS